MSVEIKPTSEIITRLRLEKGGYWHKRLAELCKDRMTDFVPKDSGELRRKAHIEDTTIVYPGPYAHYMYEGKVYVDPLYNVAAFPIRNGKISFDPKDGAIEGFVSRKNVTKIPTNRDLVYHEPGTGHHWDERMVSAYMDEIEKIIEKEMSGKRG